MRRRSEGKDLSSLRVIILVAYRYALYTHMAESSIRLQSYKLPPK